jgi:hypothetical protein
MHEVTSEQVDVSAMQDPEAAATINHRRIHVLFNIQVRRHGRPVPRPVRYTVLASVFDVLQAPGFQEKQGHRLDAVRAECGLCPDSAPSQRLLAGTRGRPRRPVA